MCLHFLLTPESQLVNTYQHTAGWVKQYSLLLSRSKEVGDRQVISLSKSPPRTKPTPYHLKQETKMAVDYLLLTCQIIYMTESYDTVNNLLSLTYKNCSFMKFNFMCTRLVTAAISVISKEWNKAKCPSTKQRLNKTGGTHAMRHYAAVEKNEDTLYYWGKMSTGCCPVRKPRSRWVCVVC